MRLEFKDLKTHRLPQPPSSFARKRRDIGRQLQISLLSPELVFSHPSFPDSETCYDSGVRKRPNSRVEGTKNDTSLPPISARGFPGILCCSEKAFYRGGGSGEGRLTRNAVDVIQAKEEAAGETQDAAEGLPTLSARLAAAACATDHLIQAGWQSGGFSIGCSSGE